jgi:ribonucleoside-diphosphate reductase alpha chain
MEKSTTRTGALNAVAVDGGLSAAGGSTSTSAAAPAAAPAASADMVEGAACYLRPGDAGFDECEACQ